MTKKERFNKIFPILEKKFGKPKCALDFETPYQLMVAVILSAQCTDERVNIVTKELFKVVREPQDIRNMDIKVLEKYIKSTGFYKNKAKNIKLNAEAMLEKYNDVIPDKMEELVELAGVGRKTANVVLGEIWDIREGIVVDTHVKRLSNHIGFVKSENPEIIEIPKMNFIAVRGKGNPNEKEGEYQKAVEMLYGVAYTLKMSYKTQYKIEGFFEYVVPPLEGFWWQAGIDGVDYSDKSSFNWISVIRIPDFVTKKDFDWAVKTAAEKKKIDCSSAEFLSIEEGLCVQIMHNGSYDDEQTSVKIMDDFIRSNGYENDMTEKRLHHEIYLSDPRKSSPEKWKTVIRHPIKKA